MRWCYQGLHDHAHRECRHSRSLHGEEAAQHTGQCDGSHHHEGCSHGREGDYEHRSDVSSRQVDSLLQEGKVEVSESGCDRGAEAMALSVEVSFRIFVLARAANVTKFGGSRPWR